MLLYNITNLTLTSFGWVTEKTTFCKHLEQMMAYLFTINLYLLLCCTFFFVLANCDGESEQVMKPKSNHKSIAATTTTFKRTINTTTTQKRSTYSESTIAKRGNLVVVTGKPEIVLRVVLTQKYKILVTGASACIVQCKSVTYIMAIVAMSIVPNLPILIYSQYIAIIDCKMTFNC